MAPNQALEARMAPNQALEAQMAPNRGQMARKSTLEAQIIPNRALTGTTKWFQTKRWRPKWLQNQALEL